MNLLKIKYIGGLFKAWWFPMLPQLVMMTVFVLLVTGCLGVTTDDPDLVNWLRNTNLSNLVVWSYWWPVIIIAAIFLGRLWCTVCPVELITYWAAKTVQTFALLLLPTIAGAHIIKSIIKMSSRIPYWGHAFSDPKGIETAQRIVAAKLVLDKSVTDALDPAISFIAAAVLLVALAATVQIFHRSVIVHKHSPGVKVVLLLSVLAYWSIFGLTIFRWRFS